MKKMFVFDYDGTYYRNPLELKENMNLMNYVRSQGHLLVIATGRSYESFMKEANRFSLNYDYLILASGALVLDQEKVIRSYPMTMDLVIGVDQLLEPLKKRCHSHLFIDEFKNSSVLSELDQVIKMSYTLFKEEGSFEVRALINDYTKEKLKTYVVSGETQDYIEIISSDTNKAVAIKVLLDYLEEDYRVITAGDSENDLEMLEAFDGYLMSNHDKRLQTKGLKVIDSIEAIINIELKNQSK